MIHRPGSRKVVSLPQSGSRRRDGHLDGAGVVRLRAVAGYVSAKDHDLHRSEEIGQGHHGPRSDGTQRQELSGRSDNGIARGKLRAGATDHQAACHHLRCPDRAADRKSVIVERLLTISGEDTLTVGRKFKLAWTGRLPTRIAILTNEMLSLADGSGALVGRFVVLLFPTSFYGKENVGLTNELLTELPGILNWAIDGYDRLRERGQFVQPENAAETIEMMEMLGAPIKAFIRDHCDVGPTQTVGINELYGQYEEWCKQTGLKPKSKPWFGRDLSAAVPGLTVIRQGDERTPTYQGIGMDRM